MDKMTRKSSLVAAIEASKVKSGKTYSQIAKETGLTNVYVGQLLKRQAPLNLETAPILKAALPDLSEEMIQEMLLPPLRSYDPSLIQDPAIYRLNEAINHFGESIKEIINEDFGDGIMSAIDFYCSVDKVKGADGKDRVVVTFDGKYLPYTVQMQIGQALWWIEDQPQDGACSLERTLYHGEVKNKELARSSAEAEFRAVAIGICELLWIRRVLQELKQPIAGTIRFYCDSKSAISIANNLSNMIEQSTLKSTNTSSKKSLKMEVFASYMFPQDIKLLISLQRGCLRIKLSYVNLS